MSMQLKSSQQSLQFPMYIEMPQVPKDFIKRPKVNLILCHTAKDFDFEERQALYYYCFLNAPISEIAEKVGLSQSHVVSVLGLYSGRLSSKLELFKRALAYDSNDLQPVSEIMLQYHETI